MLKYNFVIGGTSQLLLKRQGRLILEPTGRKAIEKTSFIYPHITNEKIAKNELSVI